MGTKTVLFSFFFGNRADTILPNKPFSLQKTVLSPRNTHISAWNPYWRGLSRTTMCSHIPTHIGWLNCLRRRGDSSFPASSEGMKMRLPSLFEMLVIDESIPPPPAGAPHILTPGFKWPLERGGGRHSHWVGPAAAVAFLADDGGAEMLGVGEGESVQGLHGRQRLNVPLFGGQKRKTKLLNQTCYTAPRSLQSGVLLSGRERNASGSSHRHRQTLQTRHRSY